MATALAFGLALTTLLVLILVPVMYSFFGTSAREEDHEDDVFVEGASAVDPDEAEREWLPDSLRDEAPTAAAATGSHPAGH